MVKREPKKILKIGELAQAAQCSVETIRYYEASGLLPRPERAQNNYRLYEEQHEQRLIFIRNCRLLDMSHQEISNLLKIADQPTTDCGSINAILEEHIAHVDLRIQELSRLKEQLNLLLRKCQHKTKVRDCLILQDLSQAKAQDAVDLLVRTTHL